MKAIKANKVYSISESEKAHYIALGFDIKDDNGNAIAYGQGKTVSYEEYAKLEAAHKELIDALEEKGSNDELSDMTLDELKAYAETNNIDLGQATSQDGILKKIRVAQKA
ncbi:MAG: hypothetical protein K0R92_1521 [Lachnospiraceae bacterium]|jgi:hypothetical protein|nr:hypothetical protein [Lachnospiraceae bacterium]